VYENNCYKNKSRAPTVAGALGKYDAPLMRLCCLLLEFLESLKKNSRQPHEAGSQLWTKSYRPAYGLGRPLIRPISYSIGPRETPLYSYRHPASGIGPYVFWFGVEIVVTLAIQRMRALVLRRGVRLRVRGHHSGGSLLGRGRLQSS
jgi:hypothetical protein